MTRCLAVATLILPLLTGCFGDALVLTQQVVTLRFSDLPPQPGRDAVLLRARVDPAANGQENSTSDDARGATGSISFDGFVHMRFRESRIEGGLNGNYLASPDWLTGRPCEILMEWPDSPREEHFRIDLKPGTTAKVGDITVRVDEISRPRRMRD